MKKRWSILIATAMCSAALAGTAFASGWQQSADGRYWFAKDNGAVTGGTSAWRMDSAGQWYMGADRNAGDNGYCTGGWWWIYDGASQMMKCYYFDAQGYMLSNASAPDGSQVNEKGEWVKDGAVVSIFAPGPNPALRADFDYTQYLPGTYEANAAACAARTGWQKNANGWWYKSSADGQYLKDGWWWIFDPGVQAMKCYYFDAQGYMLSNASAPDGGQLNVNGEWIKNGAVQVMAAPKAEAAIPYGEAAGPAGGSGSTESGGLHVVTKRVYGNSSYSASDSGSAQRDDGEDWEAEDEEENTEEDKEAEREQQFSVNDGGKADAEDTGTQSSQQENTEASDSAETNGTEADDAQSGSTETDSAEEEAQQPKTGWRGDIYFLDGSASSWLDTGWWWIDEDPRDGSTDGKADLYYFKNGELVKNAEVEEYIYTDENGKPEYQAGGPNSRFGYRGKWGAQMPIEKGGVKKWERADTEKENYLEEEEKQKWSKTFDDFYKWADWYVRFNGISTTLIGGDPIATADFQLFGSGENRKLSCVVRMKKSASDLPDRDYDRILDEIEAVVDYMAEEYVSRGLMGHYEFTVEMRAVNGRTIARYINGMPIV